MTKSAGTKRGRQALTQPVKAAVLHAKNQDKTRKFTSTFCHAKATRIVTSIQATTRIY